MFFIPLDGPKAHDSFRQPLLTPIRRRPCATKSADRGRDSIPGYIPRRGQHADDRTGLTFLRLAIDRSGLVSPKHKRNTIPDTEPFPQTQWAWAPPGSCCRIGRSGTVAVRPNSSGEETFPAWLSG